MCSVLDVTFCLTLSVPALYTLYGGITFLEDRSSSDRRSSNSVKVFYARTVDYDSRHTDEADCKFDADELCAIHGMNRVYQIFKATYYSSFIAQEETCYFEQICCF